jgi:LEA14-like dessication related protein
MREYKRLAINILVVSILVLAGYGVYKLFFGSSNSDEIVIDDTPLKVEQIRSILELNAIRFKDEVVVDSIELYTSSSDVIEGSLNKIFDYDQFKHGVRNTHIKRELTLLVKGELLYGVDLKTKDFEIIPKGDSMMIKIPNPELLSLSISPNKTEVYLENGTWQDYERRALERKARQKMIDSGERLKLAEKAKEPIKKIISQLLKTEKTVIVEFI